MKTLLTGLLLFFVGVTTSGAMVSSPPLCTCNLQVYIHTLGNIDFRCPDTACGETCDWHVWGTGNSFKECRCGGQGGTRDAFCKCVGQLENVSGIFYLYCVNTGGCGDGTDGACADFSNDGGPVLQWFFACWCP